MHSFSLSSEQDLANFLKNKNFKKIFILCGKKSYVDSGAKKNLDKYLKNKIISSINVSRLKSSEFLFVTQEESEDLHPSVTNELIRLCCTVFFVNTFSLKKLLM